jgi:acyl-CoA synthetase (AMP-forming)/AMP-acid ligase II
MRTSFSSVTEMIEARAAEFPDYEIVGVPNKSFVYDRYTYLQLDETSTRLAHYYTNAGFKSRTHGDTTSQLVVALLAPSGFDYVVNELALVKMGEFGGGRRRC